jgi:DNA-binding NtrC family response regulator
LRNAIERAVILADGGLIRSEHLPVAGARPSGLEVKDRDPVLLVRDAPIPAGGVSLESIERQLVTRALNQARFNKTRAARLLGLTRAQLYSRIEKYGLADPTPE